MAIRPKDSLRAFGAALSRVLPKYGERKSSPSRRLIALSNLLRPVWPASNLAQRAKEGFARNAIAYRCVRVIAENAAAAPMRVEVEGAQAADHPLARLLMRPNVEETGQELFEALLGHLQIAGDAYLELVEVDGLPRALHALRPDRVSVVPGPQPGITKSTAKLFAISSIRTRANRPFCI